MNETSGSSKKRPLKVLFVDDHLGYPSGVVHGTTTYQKNILPAFDNSRVKPFLAILRSYHPAEKVLAESGVEVTFFDRAKWDPRALIDIIKLIRKLDIDVVQANGHKSHFLCRLAGMLTGAKIIVHLHLIYKPGPVWLNRILAKKTARAIAVSNVLRRLAIDAFCIPAEHAQTIYNPLDVARFANPTEGARSRIRQEFDIGEKQPVITVCGRITTLPDKGQLVAIRMFAKLSERQTDVILMLVGDGPARAKCEKLAETLGLRDKVRFAGQRDDFPDILAATDVLLVPSIVEEAFGYVAIEAMCAKRPVISSNVGGMGEALGDGERGFLVNMSDIDNVVDVCEKLITQPDCATILLESAWNFASKLTIEEHVRQLYDFYDDILMEPPRNYVVDSK